MNVFRDETARQPEIVWVVEWAADHGPEIAAVSNEAAALNILVNLPPQQKPRLYPAKVKWDLGCTSLLAQRSTLVVPSTKAILAWMAVADELLARSLGGGPTN